MNRNSKSYVRGALAVTVGALLLAGCGGGDDEDQIESESVPESAQPEDRAAPEPITDAGAQAIDIDERLVNELEIEGGPSWLADGFGSLWLKRDDGVVMRIDAESGKVIAEIETAPFKQPVCQGLGVGDDAIWTCPRGGTLVRIDPSRNTADAEITIDNLVDQVHLASMDGAVWVLTKEGHELTAIDTGTGKTSLQARLPETCNDLSVLGDSIWITCYVADKVLQVDARSGKVVDELELDGPRAIAAGKELWVGFGSGVAQIDPNSLEVLNVYEAYPGVTGAIFAGPSGTWVREEGERFLMRIDPELGEITEVIEAPQLQSGGDVVQIGDSVWATAYNDAALVQLRAK
jgi:glutamine cyclotransferase